MNILSLFDGISCGRIAAERAGFNVENYYASEMDKYAITVTQANWPNTIQLGDVTKWREWDIDWSSIDLLIGGSPCQGFSGAGEQGGTKAVLNGVTTVVSDRETYLYMKDQGAEFLSQSYLFWEYVLCLDYTKEMNPSIKFMLENVKMSDSNLNLITDALEVEPVLINSSDVSAQNRKRYYWANWEFQGPEDKGILLPSILEDLPDCPIGIAVREKSKCVRVGGRNSPFGCKQEWDSMFQRISKKGTIKPSLEKAACLTGGANSGGNHSDMDIIHTEFVTRRYSITECERLQTLPDGYTQNKGVSNSQCYKALGNGWTVDVIAHIFRRKVVDTSSPIRIR